MNNLFKEGFLRGLSSPILMFDYIVQYIKHCKEDTLGSIEEDYDNLNKDRQQLMEDYNKVNWYGRKKK
jgi:hypothetical protein